MNARLSTAHPSMQALILLLTLACGGESPPIPTSLSALSPRVQANAGAKIETPSLATWRRFAMDRVLDFRVSHGSRAGYVVLVAKQHQVVYARTTGWADREAETPMALHTRFHIASMTKPITAVAALLAVEAGALSLDDPVSAYLPDFATMEVVVDRDRNGTNAAIMTEPLREPILVRHLLTFRSGLGGYAETDAPLDQAWRAKNLEEPHFGTLAERVDRVPGLPLYEQPGTRWRYGWSADVLARVVEVATALPYDEFLRTRLFEPLKMRDTGFPDTISPGPPIARMYTHDAAGKLIRETTFEDHYGVGWTPGGGGLVSTAPDFMRFALMLLGKGSLGNVQILSEPSVETMTQLHVTGGVLVEEGLEGFGWGLGLSVVADPDAAILPGSHGDYWWSGRFGTHFWVSPEAETVIVVLQQTEPSETGGLPIAPALIQGLALY